jgi:protein phosphatase
MAVAKESGRVEERQRRMMDRIAVLSDVHGNMTAFNAVLADIDGRGIDRIFNLGDLFGKGPNGSAAIATTRERCEATVIGNWDAHVGRPDLLELPAMKWWHDELSEEDRHWLRKLPFAVDLDLFGQRVRLFHASAKGVNHRVHRKQLDEEFADMFANTEWTGDGPVPDVVVYGDIHSAYVEQAGRKTLINAGSVGNPLDQPTAAYVILTVGAASSDVHAEIVRVPYDIEQEISIARKRGMSELDEYAVELRTSVYRGLQARFCG